MRSPAAVSPFAARTRQEQKEQWIWWQCQQDATMPAETKPIPDKTAAAVPELQLPQSQEPKQPENIAPPRQPIRHSQYDAVVRRMQKASGQVRNYTSVKS